METLSPQHPNTALPRISKREAEKRSLLTEEALSRMHLQPTGTPIACTVCGDGNIIYYYNPNKVKEAPLSHWYEKRLRKKEKAPEGDEKEPAVEGELRRISGRRAEILGYFSAEALARIYYEPTEPPVATTVRKNGEVVLLYDKATCRRLPLPCIKCGSNTRFRSKLCRPCYCAELAVRRAASDAKRAQKYEKDPKRVLFFDLELTGVFERDEILSVSIVDGTGKTVMDTLTRPMRNKRWKRTEKIHGITPDMVKDAPTLAEIAPRLREIFGEAEILIAYGTSTDFSHLCRIYGTREERTLLHKKMLDCAAEFSHYVIEHEIELTHHSLTDAMAHFGLEWNGLAHTSVADAHACRLVFERLYPHFYESKETANG